jgi:RNA polymerase sigma-70 factor (ECF subfamily)
MAQPIATSLDGMDVKAPSALVLEDLGSIMRLYEPNVFRFALFSVQDQDAAESITQDCFYKAYASRKQFRGECSVRTWLMRIAFNLVRATHEIKG